MGFPHLSYLPLSWLQAQSQVQSAEASLRAAYSKCSLFAVIWSQKCWGNVGDRYLQQKRNFMGFHCENFPVKISGFSPSKLVIFLDLTNNNGDLRIKNGGRNGGYNGI